jgi:hypothetical protein
VCRRVVLTRSAARRRRVRSTISRPVRIRRRIIDALRVQQIRDMVTSPEHRHVATARSPSSPSGSAPCRRRLRLGTASSRSTVGDALSSMCILRSRRLGSARQNATRCGTSTPLIRLLKARARLRSPRMRANFGRTARQPRRIAEWMQAVAELLAEAGVAPAQPRAAGARRCGRVDRRAAPAADGARERR